MESKNTEQLLGKSPGIVWLVSCQITLERITRPFVPPGYQIMVGQMTCPPVPLIHLVATESTHDTTEPSPCVPRVNSRHNRTVPLCP